MTNSATFHIRRPLAKCGGNQFYRDTTVRATSTYCGADMTDCDAAAKHKVGSWTKADGTRMIPCGRCIELRAAGQR